MTRLIIFSLVCQVCRMILLHEWCLLSFATRFGHCHYVLLKLLLPCLFFKSMRTIPLPLPISSWWAVIEWVACGIRRYMLPHWATLFHLMYLLRAINITTRCCVGCQKKKEMPTTIMFSSLKFLASWWVASNDSNATICYPNYLFKWCPYKTDWYYKSCLSEWMLKCQYSWFVNGATNIWETSHLSVVANKVMNNLDWLHCWEVFLLAIPTRYTKWTLGGPSRFPFGN